MVRILDKALYFVERSDLNDCIREHAHSTTISPMQTHKGARRDVLAFAVRKVETWRPVALIFAYYMIQDLVEKFLRNSRTCWSREHFWHPIVEENRRDRKVWRRNRLRGSWRCRGCARGVEFGLPGSIE